MCRWRQQTTDFDASTATGSGRWQKAFREDLTSAFGLYRPHQSRLSHWATAPFIYCVFCTPRCLQGTSRRRWRTHRARGRVSRQSCFLTLVMHSFATAPKKSTPSPGSCCFTRFLSPALTHVSTSKPRAKCRTTQSERDNSQRTPQKSPNPKALVEDTSKDRGGRKRDQNLGAQAAAATAARRGYVCLGWGQNAE